VPGWEAVPSAEADTFGRTGMVIAALCSPYQVTCLSWQTAEPAYTGAMLKRNAITQRRTRIQEAAPREREMPRKVATHWRLASPGENSMVLLATGARDRLVHVFESGPAALPLCQTLDNHSSSVTAVKFARDGRMLLSCGGDKALVLSSVRGTAWCPVRTLLGGIEYRVIKMTSSHMG
jgi:WD40 repeat protein